MMTVAVLINTLTISNINELINNQSSLQVEDEDGVRLKIRPAPEVKSCLTYSKEYKGAYQVPVIIEQSTIGDDSNTRAILFIWAEGWQKTKRTSLRFV